MTSITLIAHNIRSTHNVGSIFRSAEGFGVKKIILSGYTPYPTFQGDTRLPHEAEKITQQIHKTALGAESLVPFEHISDIRPWVQSCSLPVIALEQTPTATLLQNFTPPNKFALLLGEEVHGVEEELLKLCDTAIEIPMVGKKESFNVSVATGIALYALTI
ncbi:TrmH family RNA methyltransferase [Candidatus Saccharibacteria bacterium]|nr:TrmH family RNA methyltransferase [Candidatus Saccharibacteria bacterium]